MHGAAHGVALDIQCGRAAVRFFSEILGISVTQVFSYHFESLSFLCKHWRNQKRTVLVDSRPSRWLASRRADLPARVRSWVRDSSCRWVRPTCCQADRMRASIADAGPHADRMLLTLRDLVRLRMRAWPCLRPDAAGGARHNALSWLTRSAGRSLALSGSWRCSWRHWTLRVKAYLVAGARGRSDPAGAWRHGP